MAERVAPHGAVRQEMRVRHLCFVLALSTALPAAAVDAPPVAKPKAAPKTAAESCPEGKSNQPVPRFVSIKSGRAHLRAGPDDQRYPIVWVYIRKGLPVEVIGEYCIWRQIRDPDGATGWVNKQLLQSDRTAMVQGAIRPLYTSPNVQSRVAWRIEPGTVVALTLCEGQWCRVSTEGRSGYIMREQIWGTYPNEAVGGS